MYCDLSDYEWCAHFSVQQEIVGVTCYMLCHMMVWKNYGETGREKQLVEDSDVLYISGVLVYLFHNTPELQADISNRGRIKRTETTLETEGVCKIHKPCP